MLAGIVELAAGLLIAFNVGTRAMAIVLILFTAVEIYYAHNFWAVTGPQREAMLVGAVLHAALIGGLLMFVALGASQPGEPVRRGDV
jgi:uncharacterized membrane protein YphA (DoxX/SURF4 family)